MTERTILFALREAARTHHDKATADSLRAAAVQIVDALTVLTRTLNGAWSRAARLLKAADAFKPVPPGVPGAAEGARLAA